MTTVQLDYDTRTRRLALGIEFTDAMRAAELAHPVRLEIERYQPHNTPAPYGSHAFSQSRVPPLGLMRGASGRYSLSYHPGIREQVTLRIYDHGRHYVPRRMRLPLRTLADVLAGEASENPNYMDGRTRQISLFPGAGYDAPSNITALRGRVVRDGKPMRWAYIDAHLPGGGAPVARARGDDRGEFFLMLPPNAVPASDLPPTFDIGLSVAGPATVPVPAQPSLPEQDPWWDLPVEEVPPPGDVDNVSNGASFPAGYVTALSTVATVAFVVGRVLTGREVADFDFVMP